MAESARELLQKGIEAARAGQMQHAQALLREAVRRDPQNETVWLWLSSVAKDNQERVFCLRQLLAVNPNNEMARKGLRALGVLVEQPKEPTGGVPVVSEGSLAAAQPALDELLAQHSAGAEPKLGFEWVRKTGRRVGERSATHLMLGVVGGVVAVVAVVLLIVAAIGIPRIQAILAKPPTLTPAPPTFTPTATPGPTNTPSVTPRVSPTPSPTYGPEVPAGTKDFGRYGYLTPTKAHFVTPHPGLAEIENASRAYIAQEYDEAIRLARQARQTSAELVLDAYFYEGMSYAAQGDYARAEAVLLSGRERGNIALLNAALGYVYYQMGQLQESTRCNLAAIEQDRRLVMPVVIQADVYLMSGRNGEALNILRQALEQPALIYNVQLIVKRGEVYLAMGNYERAMTDARLALYVDPFAESAYRLAARTDIATGRYGMAVIDLQTYLFYFPGSVPGWTLLGEARYLEGNLGLALAAYNQALAAETPTQDTVGVYLSRGNMYLQRGLYRQAFADFDAALGIGEDRRAREGRAVAAFITGRYALARSDAEAVLEDEGDNTQMQLVLGQALVHLDECEEAESTLRAALAQELSADQQAAAHEYLARAYYDIAEDLPPEEWASVPGLQEINMALQIKETGSRHYYRGLILEQAGQPVLAKPDYEWVLGWGDVYGFPFLVEVSDRLEEIERMPTPTPTPSPTPTPES